ncbi:MAG TPA: hypothetical protein VIP70_13645 [Nitrososphaeraceae archaeon]
MKVSIRKEALYKMILEDMMAGLRDNEIIEKRKIPERTFYRYKAALAKQIKEIKEKQSEEDIALQEDILYRRLTADRVNAAAKAQKLDKPEWQAVASKLAVDLFVLKRDGL